MVVRRRLFASRTCSLRFVTHPSRRSNMPRLALRSFCRRFAVAVVMLLPLTPLTLTGCEDDRGGVIEEEAPPMDERSFGGEEPTME